MTGLTGPFQFHSSHKSPHKFFPKYVVSVCFPCSFCLHFDFVIILVDVVVIFIAIVFTFSCSTMLMHRDLLECEMWPFSSLASAHQGKKSGRFEYKGHGKAHRTKWLVVQHNKWVNYGNGEWREHRWRRDYWQFLFYSYRNSAARNEPTDGVGGWFAHTRNGSSTPG